jgi:cytochrome c oxidase subunit III
MEKAVNTNNVQTNEMRKNNSAIAMVVALVSFSMLFLTLFMSFTIFRMSNNVWPPMGFEKIPLLIPSLSTLVIVLSSFSYYRFEKKYAQNNLLSARKWFYLTLFLSVGFVVSQCFLWKQLNLWGLYVESGLFASILHGFTWIHVAHVVMGIMGLLYLLPIVRREDVSLDFEIRISNVGKFWHFLGVIWIVMFLILFVL